MNKISNIKGNASQINIDGSHYIEEIYFLKKEIEIKNREIESFKEILAELRGLKEETEKSRALITELYERKILDLKRTIEILESRL